MVDVPRAFTQNKGKCLRGLNRRAKGTCLRGLDRQAKEASAEVFDTAKSSASGNLLLCNKVCSNKDGESEAEHPSKSGTQPPARST